MSSIRLYILGALDKHGPMHGHQLRLLAEQEHVDEWTDISVGALYGAVKRLAADGLIAEMRLEREGAYPERQVYEISDAGRTSLDGLRLDGLSHTVMKPDPFDLAMTRLDRHRLDALPEIIARRLARLRLEVQQRRDHTAQIAQHLTPTELFVMTHPEARIEAEIGWHERLLAELPSLIEDELERKDTKQ